MAGMSSERPKSDSGAVLIETINGLPLAEIVDVPAWGHPTFRVGGKMFGGMDSEGTSCSLKATKEHQQVLLASDPETFYFPAYVGRHGWVGIVLGRVDPVELRELVIDAWRATAPKRVVTAWEAASGK